MAEELTTVLVLELLRELFVAFPTFTSMKTNPTGTAEMYRNHLHGLSGEALRHSTRMAIEQGKYFPKVSELREVGWEWTRRHSVEITPALGDPLFCPRCSTHARIQSRWRPALDRDGFTIYSEDGEYVQLERYERLLCSCTSPCMYSPDEGFEGPWMATHLITWSFGRKRRQPRTWRKPQQAVATVVGDIAEGVAENVMVHA